MKHITIIIGFILSFSSINATDYAILVSAGEASDDSTFSNSEYWSDLFLAYEDLVFLEGYDPNNIFVFYGDGESYNSNNARYQLSQHYWENIVDYDNAYNTLNTEFANIGSIVTNNDNLLIRFLVGHGSGNSATGDTIHFPSSTVRFPNNEDDYWILLENRNLLVREAEIIRIINQISNYNRRKIIWMTCYSGCILGGANNLNNNKTVIITASNWNEVSWPVLPSGESTYHAELNYVITSSLTGETPTRTAYYADNNGDNFINMWELWYEADNSSIMRSNPQLGNSGNIADKIFVNEHIQIENNNIYNHINYLVDDFEFLNSTIQTGADIDVDIDNIFEINGTFEIPVGSTMNIHP